MPRPGVDVVITEPAPSGGAVLDTSQGFFIGTSQRGPVDTSVELHSLKEFESNCGLRSGEAITIHDSVRAFFNERGATLHFARLSGASAIAATATVGACEATASSPGLWGNDVQVGFEAPTTMLGTQARKPNRRAKATEGNGPEQKAGPVRCVVILGDKVEKSPAINTAQDAVDWSQSSSLVRLTTTTPAQALDIVVSVPLVGGADDPTIDTDDVSAALDLFGYAKGPGQVSYPGEVDGSIQDVIEDHCARNKRCALLDIADGDAAALLADVGARYGQEGSKFAAVMAPALSYQGPASGTTVLVPYSAIQAGVIARCDRTTGNPNEAAAGTNGVILGASGLARDYTDDEREALNAAGVTLAKIVNGQVRTYGSRTCAGPDEPNWMWFANSRVIMAIGHECDAAAEYYVHKQIDAKRKIFTSLEHDLGGVCLKYVQLEALWAFKIDTGPAVNTGDTIANGEIHATVGVQASPSAEWVQIEISKTPLNQSL